MERINGRDPKEKLMEDQISVSSKKKWYAKPFGLVLLMVIAALIAYFLTRLLDLIG